VLLGAAPAPVLAPPPAPITPLDDVAGVELDANDAEADEEEEAKAAAVVDDNAVVDDVEGIDVDTSEDAEPAPEEVEEDEDEEDEEEDDEEDDEGTSFVLASAVTATGVLLSATSG